MLSHAMKPNIVDLPGSARIDAFFSPPFQTHAPELRNGHVLTPSLQELYSVLWHQSRGQHELVCSVVCDAIVEGPGLVFDQQLNLIRQSIHQATDEEVGTSFQEVSQYVKDGKPPFIPGVTLLCEKSGIGNYGHWLVEMLPVVMLNLKHLFAGGWRVRVPVAGAAMNQVAWDSLLLAGVPEVQLDFRLPGPQRYEQLVMLEGLSSHGLWYSPLIVSCLEQLAAGIPAGPAVDVWVSRAGDRRSMFEEENLCAALSGLGWTIAEPGKMTLHEQISLFKGARRIAGVNGAGLTNLVFAGPDTIVTAFMPALMPDVFFWMLSGFKKQRYREVRCIQAEDAVTPNGWNASLLLGIPEILDHLA